MGKTKTIITLGLGERFRRNLENLVSRIRRQVERHSTDCDAGPFYYLVVFNVRTNMHKPHLSAMSKLVQAVGN